MALERKTLSLKSFPVLKSFSTEDYLKAALETVEYIKKSEVVTENGKYWVSDPEDEDRHKGDLFFNETCLYGGSAGIGLFFLRLYDVTKEEKYLNEAKEAARYILATYPGKEFYEKNLNSEVGGVVKVTGWTIGLYNGPTGQAFFLEELYKHTKDERYHEYLIKAADDLISISKVNEKGRYFSHESDIFADGGFILFFIKAYYITKNQKYLQVAKETADFIAADAIERPDGSLQWTLLDLGKIEYEPGSTFVNFSHGTAGISFAFALLYEASNDKKYLTLAEKGIQYVTSIAVGDEEAALIPYLDHPVNGPTNDQFYLSWCHGPAGTTLPINKLYELTGDKKYLDWVKRLTRGIIQAGAPEYNSFGYWNSYCQCCGNAGILEHFVQTAEVTGEDEFIKYAERSANKLLRDSTNTEEGRRWYANWWRTHPWDYEVLTSLYAGTAGDAAALLRLYAHKKGIKVTLFPEAAFLKNDYND